MPNWKKVVTSGSAAELSTLSLTGLSAQSSETDVLTINTSNVIGSRQLSSGAFTAAYVLPTNLAGDNINVDTGALTGATVISDLDFNITTNTSGLVTDANGTVSTRTLTAADLSLGSSDNVTFGTVIVGDATIGGSTNSDVDTGTENVATATGAEAAFFEYVVKNSTNVRAGTITAVTDATNVEFNEISTVDLGDTSDVKLKVVLSSGDLILQATAASDNWMVSAFTKWIRL